MISNEGVCKTGDSYPSGGDEDVLLKNINTNSPELTGKLFPSPNFDAASNIARPCGVRSAAALLI